MVVGDPPRYWYIEQGDVDLIMMCTHGTSVARGWHVGWPPGHTTRTSLSGWSARLKEEIISDTLPREHGDPLSGSKPSEAVIPHAIGIAGTAPSPTWCCYAGTTKMSGCGSIWTAGRVRRGDGPHSETELLRGDPATAIGVCLAGPQLLVMATQGRLGPQQRPSSSVTENVINLVKETAAAGSAGRVGRSGCPFIPWPRPSSNSTSPRGPTRVFHVGGGARLSSGEMFAMAPPPSGG